MKFPSNPHKTALHMAIEKENLEIVKLLVLHPNVSINIPYIIINIYIKFQILII